MTKGESNAAGAVVFLISGALCLGGGIGALNQAYWIAATLLMLGAVVGFAASAACMYLLQNRKEDG